MSEKESILTENVWKLMLRMSVPGILGMLVISFNSFVDAIFAGRLISADALAGISLCIPLLFINSAVTGFISSGASNVLSGAIGNDDKGVLRYIFTYVLIFSVVASLILGVLGYLYAKPALVLLGAGNGVLIEATAYYKWMMVGCFTSIFGLAASSLIRAQGQMKYAMRVTAVAVITNVLLNPLFILYMGMGIKGSALATVISMGVYSVLTVCYLLSDKSVVKISLHGFKYNNQIAAGISSVGLSALIMQLNGFIRQVILFKTVTWYSNPTDVAFFSAVFRIFSFSVIPIFGILQAMQPIVGINFGAEKHDRSIAALRYFRIGSMSLMLIILLPILIFSETILSLLLPQMQFSTADIFYFRLLMCILPIAPIASTSVVFLQATGNGRISTYLALGRELVLFVPLMILLPYAIGRSGIYYGLFLENILYMLIVFTAVRREVGKIHILS